MSTMSRLHPWQSQMQLCWPLRKCSLAKVTLKKKLSLRRRTGRGGELTRNGSLKVSLDMYILFMAFGMLNSNNVSPFVESNDCNFGVHWPCAVNLKLLCLSHYVLAVLFHIPFSM